MNLQLPLFQKNRHTPLGMFGGRGLEEPPEVGEGEAGEEGPEVGEAEAGDEGALARSCRHLQLAPWRQPARVLKDRQTFRCDMVGARILRTFVSSSSLFFLQCGSHWQAYEACRVRSLIRGNRSTPI